MLAENVRVALRVLVLFVVVPVGANFSEHVAEVLVRLCDRVELVVHFIDDEGSKVGCLVRVVPPFLP